ncbi:hypothetical protein SISSUDRAFT_1040409 [Sistotremastrum suecicum HHB10207 ss-3]|uniref:GIY-YIG domain-containing protein n=1 Tax=Sistotremastrum suecicum HHB10207 ss-3 TaxID=1314776 RepID=A0A166I4X1_9AGAM|nr:hypothetical protein SISSUDRAFT_1040409 [Sistotremastrum suecicum HHB10207 ss-3]
MMATVKTKSKSSLAEGHRFPLFYACYLLKSIQTPTSTATYIGSTPDPPRRIRQHNGELTQGAWKTRLKRPWVMTMIVYGFPSKLAALQFEWAWQHPNVSRHLKTDGKATYDIKRTTFNKSVEIARAMICNPPYSTWPLHVKLFRPEAVKAWSAAEKIIPEMPLGFTYSTELEGVDGQSEAINRVRETPIDVKDVAFTEIHLAKWRTLSGQSDSYRGSCSVCGKPIDLHTSAVESISLCPQETCSAFTHLECLAAHFLENRADLLSLNDSSMLIPRGGPCPSCTHYILWGDVIRGMYRRKPHHGTVKDVEYDVSEDERLIISPRRRSSSHTKSDSEDEVASDRKSLKNNKTTQRRKPKESAVRASRHNARGKKEASALRKTKLSGKHQHVGPSHSPARTLSSEGECFDLDMVSGSDSEEEPEQHSEKTAQTKSRSRPYDQKQDKLNSEEPRLSMEDVLRRVRRNSGAGNNGLPAATARRASKNTCGANSVTSAIPKSTSSKAKRSHRAQQKASREESEEFFDLDNISGSTEEELIKVDPSHKLGPVSPSKPLSHAMKQLLISDDPVRASRAVATSLPRGREVIEISD